MQLHRESHFGAARAMAVAASLEHARQALKRGMAEERRATALAQLAGSDVRVAVPVRGELAL